MIKSRRRFLTASPMSQAVADPSPRPAPAGPLLKPLRDPAPMLERLRAQWGGRHDLWVFGYASLIWRPEFEAQERRDAVVHGWHRALRMRSRVNRGTPELPGLVFALLPGGSCRGVVFRLSRERAHHELDACGRARCPLACTTRAGCPAARTRAWCRRWPSRSAAAARPACRRCPTSSCCTCCATPGGATAARWSTWPKPSRPCAPTACATGRSSGRCGWQGATACMAGPGQASGGA